jgi:hypothetical protein
MEIQPTTFISILNELNDLCNHSLLDLDLPLICEKSIELSQLRRNYMPMYMVTHHLNLSDCFEFRVFLSELATLLHTPFPNWIKIIKKLHSQYVNYSSSEESMAFWSIGTPHQFYSFEILHCQDCSDQLIQSNMTGVSLRHIMLSYDCAKKMHNIDHMMSISSSIHTFINFIYFPNYLQHLIWIIDIEPDFEDEYESNEDDMDQ